MHNVHTGWGRAPWSRRSRDCRVTFSERTGCGRGGECRRHRSWPAAASPSPPPLCSTRALVCFSSLFYSAWRGTLSGHSKPGCDLVPRLCFNLEPVIQYRSRGCAYLFFDPRGTLGTLPPRKIMAFARRPGPGRPPRALESGAVSRFRISREWGGPARLCTSGAEAVVLHGLVSVVRTVIRRIFAPD